MRMMTEELGKRILTHSSETMSVYNFLYYGVFDPKEENGPSRPGSYFSAYEQIFEQLSSKQICIGNSVKWLHFEKLDNLKIFDYAKTIESFPIMAVCARNFYPFNAGYHCYDWNYLLPIIEMAIEQKQEEFLFYLIYANLLPFDRVNQLWHAACENDFYHIMFLLLKLYGNKSNNFNLKIIQWILEKPKDPEKDKLAIKLLFYFTDLWSQGYLHVGKDTYPMEAVWAVQDTYVVWWQSIFKNLQNYYTVRRAFAIETGYSLLNYIFKSNYGPDYLLKQL